jgi:surface carbohydrate biosynthesis protein
MTGSDMSRTASTLIIPVEVQVREMDAKLLLACAAAERGFPVILGSRAFTHYQASSIPRGVYLAKSMRSLSIRMFEILRKLGHEIVAWDEEALVRHPDHEYYRWRLSPVAMSRVSQLMAWGPDDERALREYPGYHGAPIHITGNPRVDLMRPELRGYYQPEVDSIRERFGEFVLVSTNFNLVNHYFSDLSQLKKAAQGEGRKPTHPAEVGKGRHKLALFEHFKQMLPVLCASLPDYTVLLRPHPGEDRRPWLEIAERCPNMQVANDGSVVPWLMASKALIANSCTTMVEAAALETPIVVFQPVVSEEFDFDLPNRLGHRTRDTDELCATIRAIVDGRLGALDRATRRATLDRHIAALDGPLAADRMVDVLEQAGYLKEPPPAAATADFVQAWVHNKARTAVKRVNMQRPRNRNNAAYHAHRFPDISVDEVERRVERLGRLLDRFENIRVREHSAHTFRITA